MASGDLIVRIADKDTLDATYEAVKNSKDDILAAIDQAVFDKQLLVDILAGTCENLTGDSITSIADYLFYMKYNLKTIDLPNCISIGKYAFFGGLTDGGDEEETNNSLLETINLPNCISIGEKSFYYCKQVSDLNLPSATSIQDYAFYGCTGLTELNLPLVTSIGSYAFYGCTGLTELNLPLVTSIGNHAFYGCQSLRKVWIPASCKNISANSYARSPFNGCTNSELKIFCEAESKPSGWESYWNYKASGSQCTVVWGATHEDYEAY